MYIFLIFSNLVVLEALSSNRRMCSLLYIIRQKKSGLAIGCTKIMMQLKRSTVVDECPALINERSTLLNEYSPLINVFCNRSLGLAWITHALIKRSNDRSGFICKFAVQYFFGEWDRSTGVIPYKCWSSLIQVLWYSYARTEAVKLIPPAGI